MHLAAESCVFLTTRQALDGKEATDELAVMRAEVEKFAGGFFMPGH